MGEKPCWLKIKKHFFAIQSKKCDLYDMARISNHFLHPKTLLQIIGLFLQVYIL